jgi:hypothetical protein
MDQPKINKVVSRVNELKASTIASKEVIDYNVSEVIKGFTSDALNLFKNITETSLMQDDFDKRVKEMCNTYGFTYSNGKFF